MSRITVVTGANKGIGFSIVKILCQSKSKEDIVYLTARDESRGMKAVAELKGLGCDAAFHQLDLDSLESIKKLSNYLKQTYGGLDILVNNAGVAYKGSSTAPFDEQAEVTNRTNYFGTLNVCKHLIPLIKDRGRVVHVSSQCGHYSFSKMQPSLQN
jgi:carbonyl reductase 1